MEPVIEKLLSNREAALEPLLNSLLEGVMIVESSRRVKFANSATCSMLGIASEKILGRPYDLVLFGQDKTASDGDLAVCPIQFALTEGAASHVPQGVFMTSGGTGLHVEYSCQPLFDEQRVVGTIITFRDSTQRLEVESAIAAARDAALEAARTKAAFLANVSHEIRTPLSGIVGTANLLSDTDLSPEQANFVDLLKRSIGSLLEIVNDILDFSKIEAGKLRLSPVIFNLSEIVDETIAVHRSAAEGKGLALTRELEPALAATFRGDAGRLRQVLGNLVSNAVKFTVAGSVSVSVRRLGKDEVIFEVADTGIGIDETQGSMLFQPFTQGDASMTRRFGGTGLGLAISRELIGLMNGAIGFESKVGEGSRFWFHIPLERAEIGDEQSDSLHVSESPPGKFRVLLAEDNDITSEIVSTLLSQMGCKVTTAINGAEAVAIAEAKKFDLIMMDCQMPELDGFEAARKIRESAGPNRAAKIIALTAHSAETERDRCLDAGMDDFLCKPLTRDDLAALFERHFTTPPDPASLDLRPKVIQHSLSKYVTPEVLESLLAIEARGETNFISEIYKTYVGFTAGEISNIRLAADRGDLSDVRRRAHSLKGSSANVGVGSMRDLCAELEIAAASGGRISEMVSRLDGQFGRLKRELELIYETPEEDIGR